MPSHLSYDYAANRATSELKYRGRVPTDQESTSRFGKRRNVEPLRAAIFRGKKVCACGRYQVQNVAKEGDIIRQARLETEFILAFVHQPYICVQQLFGVLV